MSNLPNLLTQPFKQTLLANLNHHAWLLEPQRSRSRASLRWWQHKLRLLKEDQPDQSLRQSGPFFTKWCLSNQVDFRAPPLKVIADFLLYLFQDGKLQLGTIDGYRSNIADNWKIRPLMSARMRISLASWIATTETEQGSEGHTHTPHPTPPPPHPTPNLSLVLHQLTKATFEPLKEASLKHLTFKTVFLLALGQGGSRQCGPVAIPVFTPTLDQSLKDVKSLCPVKALCYYLDRTSDLRKNKELVFVSFKKGFDKDISPATISSWIKLTVIQCYELSYQQALTLHQVKTHDVRAFAASKAFSQKFPSIRFYQPAIGSFI